MIIKLKTWEQAKEAEIEHNRSELISDGLCFGIGEDMLPWGASLDADYSWHSESTGLDMYEYGGFTIPSWMVEAVYDKDRIIECGNRLIDRTFTNCDFDIVRIRIIELDGVLYYHSMKNGILLECRKINGNTHS